MGQGPAKQTQAIQLEPPRIAPGQPLTIAGLRMRYGCGMQDLPAQWQRFAPRIGKVPGQVGSVAYGVASNLRSADGIDYLAGVEVSGTAGLPADFSVVQIPAQRYAVFAHREHVSRLRETMEAIERWLPLSGYKAPEGTPPADFFERYSEEFNPQTGMGGIEVWVPIQG